MKSVNGSGEGKMLNDIIKILIVTALLFLGVLILTACKANNSVEAQTQARLEQLKNEAVFCCRAEARKRLKSPSSGKFPWFASEAAVSVTDNQYTVAEQMDAVNSFGVVLRYNYMCKVKVEENIKRYTWEDKNSWEVLSIKIY